MPSESRRVSMKSTEDLTGTRDIRMPMRRETGVLSFALIFLPAAILFCVGAVSDITVPGIYMDAVNPDYLVVRLFHPEALNTPYWSFPENVVFDRFPVLGGNFYYGALTFYLGAPVYALAGTGVVGIRVANMVFGLLVLAATAIFLQAFRVRPVIAATTLAMLALDPGFLFSFRTQFYITLLPVAPLFLSVALAESRGAAATRRVAIWAEPWRVSPAMAISSTAPWCRRRRCTQLGAGERWSIDVHCWVGGGSVSRLLFLLMWSA
jgi:hypothetical protein